MDILLAKNDKAYARSIEIILRDFLWCLKNHLSKDIRMIQYGNSISYDTPIAKYGSMSYEICPKTPKRIIDVQSTI